MAARDSTAPDVAQSPVSPPTPGDELADALYGLSGAISLVKVVARAPLEKLHAAQHEQAMELVIDQLDEAYNAMDLAIVQLGPDGAGSAVERTSPGEPDAPKVVSEKTADRIRAYLMSVRPMRGVADLAGDDRYQRGRSAIERMALSAPDTEMPTLKLTAAQCADVLYFVARAEPVEPRACNDMLAPATEREIEETRS